MKILVAEDDRVNALVVERTLQKAGYQVVVTRDGAEAIERLEKEQFDGLVVDWMMPEIDGIGVIRHIRREMSPESAPAVVMLTAMSDDTSREHALNSGADDFLGKPLNRATFLDVIGRAIQRARSGAAPASAGEPGAAAARILSRPVRAAKAPPTASGGRRSAHNLASFAGVAIAASTGGPPVLIEVLRAIELDKDAAVFVAIHGPDWMHVQLAKRIERDLHVNAVVPNEGDMVMPGFVYIAGRGQHLTVTPEWKFALDDGPEINFTKPAADPLLTSVADRFGSQSMGVVLTGLGRDGGAGCAAIAEARGRILVQDPTTAVAPSMPRTAVASVPTAEVMQVYDIGHAVKVRIKDLARRRKAAIHSAAHAAHS